jgi:hypothetical protein
MFFFADDRPMSGPCVTIQLSNSFNDSYPQGIEVNAADEGEKVVVFVAENGFIPIFEQVASSLVAAVEVLCVPLGQEFPHGAGNAAVAAPEQNVYIIPHQRPGIHGVVARTHGKAESIKE